MKVDTKPQLWERLNRAEHQRDATMRLLHQCGLEKAALETRIKELETRA